MTWPIDWTKHWYIYDFHALTIWGVVYIHIWLYGTVTPIMFLTYEKPYDKSRVRTHRGVQIVCIPEWHFKSVEVHTGEKGDELTEWVFTITDWPARTRGWFYFRAHHLGDWAIGTSPLFSYWKGEHYWVQIFYPDPDPGVTCGDGYIERRTNSGGTTWPSLHAGPADGVYPQSAIGQVGIGSGNYQDLWRWLYRGQMCFDTSSLPNNAILEDVRLYLRVSGKSGTANWPDWYLVLTNYFPLDPTTMTLQDWWSFGTTYYSDAWPWGAFTAQKWFHFDLNSNGFAAVDKNGITKIGLREWSYDCKNTPPPWVKRKSQNLTWYSADGPEDYWPYLRVVYRIPYKEEPEE